MAKKISMPEAAEMCGVSETTIRRYIAAGLVTAYRVGPRMIRLDAARSPSSYSAPLSRHSHNRIN